MTQWAYRHRRSILFALGLIAIAGFFEIYEMPVSLFPQVTFPRVVVNLNAGDMPAERMAVQVTWPVEEAVRAVPGVLTVRSATSRGSSDISINFNWGSCRIPDDYIIPSRHGYLLARSVLQEILGTDRGRGKKMLSGRK